MTTSDLEKKLVELWQGGDLAATAKIAKRLIKKEKGNKIALQFLAKWSLSNKDFKAAAGYWKKLSEVSSPHWEIFIGWSQAAENDGDLEGAILACKKGLKALKGDYLILFVLGQLSQKAGYEKQATTAFFHCYQIISSLKAKNDEPLKAQLSGHQPQFEFSMAHLDKSLGGAISKAVAKLGEKVGEPIKRVETTKYVRFLKGPVGDNVLHQPQVIFMPDLPSWAWFDKAALAFIPGLEENFEALRQEVLENLRPEVDFKPTLKENQNLSPDLAPLAGSSDWGAYYFHENFKPSAEAQKRFPKIWKAIADLPLYGIEGLVSGAKLSALKPGLKVPPHFGLNNTTLNIHLPLVVPGDCGITVGGETRQYELGKCLVFDDSFIHDIWNKASERLIVLSFEVWKPGITEIEKQALEEAAKAENDWYQQRIYETLLEE